MKASSNCTVWSELPCFRLKDARAAALLQAHATTEVAAKLNEEGFTSGAGAPFSVGAVSWLQQRWGLKSYRDHLLAAGKLTTTEMTKQLGLRAIRGLRAGCSLGAPRHSTPPMPASALAAPTTLACRLTLRRSEGMTRGCSAECIRLRTYPIWGRHRLSTGAGTGLKAMPRSLLR